MATATRKVLFVPVSGTTGIGEYMRSSIIAEQLALRYPDWLLAFVLNKQAPYALACPYKSYLLDDSPTKCVDEVNQIISDFRPDVVVFDASGRQSQLAHAKACGAKVIFFSQHEKKRRRGLKPSRLKVTDAHFVVQPAFTIKPLALVERIILKVMNEDTPECIGPVFSPVDQNIKAKLLAKHDLIENQFLLFNAGSGGHKVAGKLAANEFAFAAAKLAKSTGLTCVMIYGSNYPETLPDLDGVIAIKQVDNSEFMALLEAAKINVIAGGDSLLQALALKKVCVAVPVSKDQPARIKRCMSAHAIVSAELDQESMVRETQALLTGEQFEQLHARIKSLGMENGLTQVMAFFERYIAD